MKRIEDFKWRHAFHYHGVDIPGEITVAEVARNRGLNRPGLFEDKRVLDIGTWDGGYAYFAEEKGAQEVVAIDTMISKDTYDLEEKREVLNQIHHSDVRFLTRDLYDMSPEDFGSFDTILFMGVIYHLRDSLTALETLDTLLKPGGILVLECRVFFHTTEPALFLIPRESKYHPNLPFLLELLDHVYLDPIWISSVSALGVTDPKGVRLTLHAKKPE